MKDENLSVVCVPTSYQARQLIIDYKLTLGNLDTNPKVSIKPDITNSFKIFKFLPSFS